MPQLEILTGKTYCIKTFGCQMNLHDSERVSGLLDSLGAFEAQDLEHADIVVFMTCCVREAADTRLYGQCNSCKSLPAPPSGKRVIAVGGCIAQRDGEGLLTNVDNVDVIFGTHAIAHVGELLAAAFEKGERQILTNEDEEHGATSMPWHRASNYHAWVPIMTGCNNFCSYCIVPYVRGREKSRPMEEILDEVRILARKGVREITLLGQNVNSYGRNIYGKPRFAELLRHVGDTGIERISFTSSHPKDLLPETIDAMAEVDAVVPHLHLAVQSGSSRVLKLMNRRYTREHYIDVIDQVRARIPRIALTTDIIVGFPGETEEDFLETLSLAERVAYSQAFTFIYSKREGTPAAEIEDSTTREEILDRFNRLVHVIEHTAYAYNQNFLHECVPSLIEGPSKKDPNKLQGKSPWNQTVICPIPEGLHVKDCVGKILDVQVDTSRTFYLAGTAQGLPR
ncbi:tRNA (N6-isopentenyl adenosine(37)-C2)-methylthiotransferase MiaB [Collinsella sp. zg1085]|uniref:tRNA (N6-isopentenyl adenosine(37)-C2)-methylthiotransferase MiaB n=1 Tax=Collinsella sp. zg1085 TaxID=2844380 RepID=UPI001C0C2F4F|nr:tRNA (N6-isopentenyl adenosine(37)-C2)-methylthiotransferase MiaB [Collinsella sp. zg1085]QWT16999.1 tRNA (N6-isopentenyl adenosine(37)-C2)-methylthiotransferase MiaB [Collinsella sp. zg1085]